MTEYKGSLAEIDSKLYYTTNGRRSTAYSIKLRTTPGQYDGH